jgi:PHP family Zn ribbon phosphoesterase
MKTNATANNKEACPRCHIVLSTSARRRGVCSECGTKFRKGTGGDPRVKQPDSNRRVKPL